MSTGEQDEVGRWAAVLLLATLVTACTGLMMNDRGFLDYPGRVTVSTATRVCVKAAAVDLPQPETGPLTFCAVRQQEASWPRFRVGACVQLKTEGKRGGDLLVSAHPSSDCSV